LASASATTARRGLSLHSSQSASRPLIRVLSLQPTDPSYSGRSDLLFGKVEMKRPRGTAGRRVCSGSRGPEWVEPVRTLLEAPSPRLGPLGESAGLSPGFKQRLCQCCSYVNADSALSVE